MGRQYVWFELPSYTSCCFFLCFSQHNTTLKNIVSAMKANTHEIQCSSFITHSFIMNFA